MSAPIHYALDTSGRHQFRYHKDNRPGWLCCQVEVIERSQKDPASFIAS